MRTWFAFVVALLLVLSAPGFVLAQDTSPVAEEGMPEGVAFEILAQRLVEEFPTGPAEIGFARLTFAPGTRLNLDPEPSLVLVAVESGTFTVTITTAVEVAGVVMEGTPVATRVTTAGVAFPVEPGESVLVPPLATGDVRNDGPEPVVALAVFIGPPTAAMATPGPEATPMAEEEAAAGLTFEPLGFGVVDQLPSGPAALVIARVRIAPGVNLPADPQPGPEVGYSEAGDFAFQTTGGPGVQVVRNVALLATPGAEPTMKETGPGQDMTVSVGDAFFIPTGRCDRR